MYKTFQVGAFRAIEPEAIRAQDGDSGINTTVTYSISSGKQQSSEFSLDQEGKVLYMIPNPLPPKISDRYCLCSVSPEKYGGRFDIDKSTGVLSVLTSFDREEMSSSDVLISIKVVTSKPK